MGKFLAKLTINIGACFNKIGQVIIALGIIFGIFFINIAVNLIKLAVNLAKLAVYFILGTFILTSITISAAWKGIKNFFKNDPDDKSSIKANEKKTEKDQNKLIYFPEPKIGENEKLNLSSNSVKFCPTPEDLLLNNSKMSRNNSERDNTK